MVNVLGLVTRVGATMITKKVIRSAVTPAAFGLLKPVYYVGEAGLCFAAGDLATASMMRKEQALKQAIKMDIDKKELKKLIEENPRSTQI